MESHRGFFAIRRDGAIWQGILIIYRYLERVTIDLELMYKPLSTETVSKIGPYWDGCREIKKECKHV